MYDDDVQIPVSLTANDRYYKVAKFPTRNIRTPIVLLYGDADSLVDIDVMLKQLPSHTVARAIPSFEHLDFLWAEDIHTLVFPTIFQFLKIYRADRHEYHLERQLPYEWLSQAAPYATTTKISQLR